MAALPTIVAASLFDPAARAAIEALLPAYVAARRWYRHKSRTIVSVTFDEPFAMPFGEDAAAPAVSLFALALVTYADGGGDRYALPLATAEGPEAEQLLLERPHLAVARFEGTSRVVHDALGNPGFLSALLRRFVAVPRAGRRVEAPHGALVFRATTHLDGEITPTSAGTRDPLHPQPVLTEQTNTSVVFGTSFILKVLRQVDAGASADLEMGELLTAHGYANAPQVVGAIELVRPGALTSTVGILHRFVPNRGDAWTHTLGSLHAYFERATVLGPAPHVSGSLFERAHRPVTQEEESIVGPYLALATKLGARVAEMHRVLVDAAADETSAFALEPIDRAARTQLVASTREALTTALAAARPLVPSFDAQFVGAIDARLSAFLELGEDLLASRVHGDLHLGQVLFTGDDFVLIDFEGEPSRTLAERKKKRSPLVDVAGMLRSFHYAPAAALKARAAQGLSQPPPGWSLAWYRAVTGAFLGAWLDVMKGSRALPRNEDDLMTALDLYLFEKCIYEVAYEANNRPDWISIPLEGLADLITLPNAGAT